MIGEGGHFHSFTPRSQPCVFAEHHINTALKIAIEAVTQCSTSNTLVGLQKDVINGKDAIPNPLAGHWGTLAMTSTLHVA